ncbi:MAG TPA: phage terminase small subunit P27 family [Terracidiphilus sp.]|jgi:P27 family predicted phage terminase small subunit
MPNPKKPTALAVLHGNPGKRKLNAKEPKFLGKPVCPDWLHPIAKRMWKKIESEFAHTGLLTAVDVAALSAFCQSYARWRLAEEIVQREGQTIEEPIVTGQGNLTGRVKIKRHPATLCAKDAQAAMMSAGARFGLDPSSRSRIVAPDLPDAETEDDDIDADLFGPIN